MKISYLSSLHTALTFYWCIRLLKLGRLNNKQNHLLSDESVYTCNAIKLINDQLIN